MTPRSEKGFSLPELLIVVAIIGIIATVAVPGFLQTQQASRESAAIQSLRAVVSAQNTYITCYGGYRFYGDSTQLVETGLIDSFLFSEPRNRYSIALAIGAPPTSYTATAEPVAESETARYYFADNEGTIHYKIGAPAGPDDPSIPK